MEPNFCPNCQARRYLTLGPLPLDVVEKVEGACLRVRADPAAAPRLGCLDEDPFPHRTYFCNTNDKTVTVDSYAHLTN